MSAHDLDQRARILTAPSRYLTTAHTRTLTGHGAQTLVRLTQEGDLIAQQQGPKSFTYNARSVLSYCRRSQSGPLTLFDALTTVHGDHLTEDEVTSELRRTASGTWWTLVRRDQQVPPDWPSWARWFEGEHGQAEQELLAQKPRWTQQIREERARGLIHRTLWVPNAPLRTDFGQYTLAQFTHVVAAGGSVDTLPVWKVELLEDQRPLPDLEVTPRAVYVRTHTAIGARDGAVRITDPGLVKATAGFVAWAARQRATPLSDFVRWHHHDAA
ncbi:hypothetical protein KGD82_16135 [Nocardiopsis eucommiae]|uniref:Uncharacterized protein n=1 Tax=Nocardiopsis eucommiae TaxID=2831970 RepID=A0A975L5R1_9ACTN|nr:hypothetical protein KGD82_16135 [Nocardiopsis eucommiae]